MFDWVLNMHLSYSVEQLPLGASPRTGICSKRPIKTETLYSVFIVEMVYDPGAQYIVAYS